MKSLHDHTHTHTHIPLPPPPLFLFLSLHLLPVSFLLIGCWLPILFHSRLVRWFPRRCWRNLHQSASPFQRALSSVLLLMVGYNKGINSGLHLQAKAVFLSLSRPLGAIKLKDSYSEQGARGSKHFFSLLLHCVSRSSINKWIEIGRGKETEKFRNECT